MTDADAIKLLLGFIATLMTGGAFFLLRAVFENAKKGNGHGTTTKSMKIDDLHRWHSPDDSGRQDWKNPEIRGKLDAISAAITIQTESVRTGQTEIAKSIDSMHDTFTGLAEELKNGR